jgi:protein SCO1/2
MACWVLKIVKMLRTACLRNNMMMMLLPAIMVTGCQKATTDSLPYYNTPDFTPEFLSNRKEVATKITHTISHFAFVNQDGDTLTDEAIKGKIHVADFIFTSCGNICPVMTDQMTRVGKAFENDTAVVILSYTVTPWIDTPEKLKKYKQEKGIKKSNWYFLTGNKTAIYKLARQSYFAEESMGFSKDSTNFLHTEHFLLVDGNKRIRGIYNGTLQLEAEQLIKDIRTLKAEL